MAFGMRQVLIAGCCEQVLGVVIDVQNKTGKLYKDWLKCAPHTGSFTHIVA